MNPFITMYERYIITVSRETGLKMTKAVIAAARAVSVKNGERRPAGKA